MEIPAPKKKKGKTSRAGSKARADAKAAKKAANVTVEIFVKEPKGGRKIEEIKEISQEPEVVESKKTSEVKEKESNY